MAQQTIQIADKPTLDEVKALLEDVNSSSLLARYWNNPRNLTERNYRCTTAGFDKLSGKTTGEPVKVLSLTGSSGVLDALKMYSVYGERYDCILIVVVDGSPIYWCSFSTNDKDGMAAIGNLGLFGYHLPIYPEGYSNYTGGTSTDYRSFYIVNPYEGYLTSSSSTHQNVSKYAKPFVKKTLTGPSYSSTGRIVYTENGISFSSSLEIYAFCSNNGNSDRVYLDVLYSRD